LGTSCRHNDFENSQTVYVTRVGKMSRNEHIFKNEIGIIAFSIQNDVRFVGIRQKINELHLFENE